MKLCVKRIRFLVSLSLEEKKRQKFEKSIYSKSQYFLSVSSFFLLVFFSTLRKRIYLHLLQIWPQGTIFLAPLRYWSTLKIASIAKNEFRIDFKIDRQTAIYLSSNPFFPSFNKTKNFVVRLNPPSVENEQFDHYLKSGSQKCNVRHRVVNFYFISFQNLEDQGQVHFLTLPMIRLVKTGF